MHRSLCAGVVAALALAPLHPTLGGTIYATNADALEVWAIDTTTFQATLVGGYLLNDPTQTQMGIFGLVREPDLSLLGLAVGPSTGALYDVDATTGAANEIGTIPMPVGTQGFDENPDDGMLWWLDAQGFLKTPKLVSMDPTTFVVTNHGSVATGNERFAGMAFHPDGQTYALEISSNALWVIDRANPTGPGTHQIGGGLFSGIDLTFSGSLTWDKDIGALVGYSALSHALFTVDTNTGLASPLVFFGPNEPIFAVIAGRRCAGAVTQYGAGCAGAAGFVPHLGVSGCPTSGGFLTVSIEGGLGGSQALIVFGSGQGVLPLGGGCTLQTAPLLNLALSVPLTGAGPGQGQIAFGAIVPSLPGPVTLTMQALVADASSPIGGSVTNAVRLDFE